MNTSNWVHNTAQEAQLKQQLATLAGIGNHNLTDYTIRELLHEVERFGNDYEWTDCGKFMNPLVQDAYLFLYNIGE